MHEGKTETFLWLRGMLAGRKLFFWWATLLPRIRQWAAIVLKECSKAYEAGKLK
jgi:hypothetical protein